MMREQAIEALKACGRGHWHTGATCDSCWVNDHRCPPTLASMIPQAMTALKRAVDIGKEAERTLAELRKLGMSGGR